MVVPSVINLEGGECIGPADNNDDTKKMRVLRAFAQLCIAPEGEESWPALNGGPGHPGPFERGWRGFFAIQQHRMESARKKYYDISKVRGRCRRSGIPVR